MLLRLLFVSLSLFLLNSPCCQLYAQFDKDVARAEALVAEFEEMERMGSPEDWVPQLKELIDLDRAATLPICESLKTTEVDFQMRVFGFALRAIDDSRAVPTLIESIPKTLRPPGSDMGLHIDDEDLNNFMLKHDLAEKDNDKNFGLGRPCREIIGALEKITGHRFDEIPVSSIFLSGGDLNRYYQKKAYHDLASKWQAWWLENYKKAGADLDFVNVNLAPFTLEKPGTMNAFIDESAVAGSHMLGLIIAPPSTEKNSVCVYDLDMRQSSNLNRSFKGDPTNLEAIEKWAAEQGFDLMGLKVKLEGFDEPQYIIKPIDLKFWQAEADRFDTLSQDIGKENFEFGEEGREYLAFYDEKTKRYEPNKRTTFFYQTSEGTCGAIRLMAQVTEKLDLSRPVAARKVPANQGIRNGVKLEVKYVYLPSDE